MALAYWSGSPKVAKFVPSGAPEPAVVAALGRDSEPGESSIVN